MTKNKLLTATNAVLGAQFYGLVDQFGQPLLTQVLEGVPLGTSDETTTGEAGVKVIVIADRSTGQTSGQFKIPNYDSMAISYYGSTNNIETQEFWIGGLGGTLVATLTYTYVSDGAVNDDLIESIVQS